MNSRISHLRDLSLHAKNTLSAERALLLTEFYQKHINPGDSVPVQRAKWFDYLLRNKSLYYQKGELIVGERGPQPKATPTYPEISLHSLADLEILHSRPKVSFLSDAATRNCYRDVIIPFWEGRTNRDRIFASMTPEWISAYQAGIFTEFQEQRAPGHTVAGDKIYRKGMLDILGDIDCSKRNIDWINDPNAYDKNQELLGMEISARALISWAERYADLFDQLASTESDPDYKKELHCLSTLCRKVPAHAPETFHEALQYYWFVHLGVISELNPWDSFNPGRLDQHLFPFYQKGLNASELTPDLATELLECFWIKFNNHPSPPKVGVTAEESNTYTDFSLINLGGVKSDGSDGVNELTFLILDVIENMRLLQPSSMIQVSKKNPDTFIDRALRIVKTGFGQPSIFNTDAIIQELTRQGKSIVDARNGGASGCVESGAFGTEAYFLTGYFNLPKIFELTLYNGMDPRTGNQLGPKSGTIADFDSFEKLVNAFKAQLNYFMGIKIRGNNAIERIFSLNMPVPFLSLIIDDCISNGVDYVAGGARYNTSYVQGVGLGTVTDCFAAVDDLVFGKKTVTMNQMVCALNANFEGFENLRYQMIYETPKYGNNDDRADTHLKTLFELYFESLDGRPNTRGGVHRVNLLPTTCHVYFGRVTGALPDGRKKGMPVSEGISPVQGADIHGPTAVIQSAAKIDHLRTGGTLLNQKFTPEFFDNSSAIAKVRQLVRSYFRLDGHHIQFNVVSADVLRDAQVHPENYRDLIVRVAGYSDYFNDLGTDLQEEIICRTEQRV